jgi:glycosyltransferase involved in cell wall biosynthesis
MRILFFTPYFNQPRGNTTTSKRIVDSLKKLGLDLNIFAYMEDVRKVQELEQTDFVHILHATRFAAWADAHGVTIDKPYIVTMGGTDINEELQDHLNRSVYHLLQKASYITVFTEDAKDKVIQLDHAWASKTVVVPQTVWISGETVRDISYEAPKILLPAGLRTVKDILHPLPALDHLMRDYPTLTFTIIGANLDEQVHKQVLNVAHTRPWVSYVGAVPHSAMYTWYSQHNIVLNTSISEGQPLSVMEAMLLGRAVLARRNKANESLIQHEVTGWLYEDMDGFVSSVNTIMTDSPLREQVIKNAQSQMSSSPLEEGMRYLELFVR